MKRAPSKVEPAKTVKRLRNGAERSKAEQELYTPLGESETRVLYLYPGVANEPLCGTLYIASISNKEGLGIRAISQRVTYHALSYAWGGTKPTDRMEVNGMDFGITKNLRLALINLRDVDFGYYIWIDAVCINQTDAEDKSAQVAMMFTIYEKANQVVVWLGIETKSNETAFEFIERHSATQVKRRIPSDEDKESFKKGVLEVLQLTISEKGTNEAKHIQLGLLDLLQRRWMWRAWIVQEVFAARSKIVRIGSIEMTWNQFLSIRDYINVLVGWMYPSQSPTAERCSHGTGNDSTLQHPISYLRRWSFGQMSHWPYEGPGDMFLALLREGIHLGATDDRDRVYALLGLVKVYQTQIEPNPNWPPLPVIDYRLSASQVYQDVACFIMNCCRSISLLYLTLTFSPRPFNNFHTAAKSINTSNTALELPSWTPDWCSVSTHRNVPPQLLEVSTATRFRRQSPGFLHLEGLQIAKISDVDDIQIQCSPECSYCTRPWRKQATARISDDFHADAMRIRFYTRESMESSTFPLEKDTSLRDSKAFWKDNGSTSWFVAQDTRPGDLLVHVLGGYFPLVLRPRGSESYSLVSYAEPSIDHLLPPDRLAFCEKIREECCLLLKNLVKYNGRRATFQEPFAGQDSFLIY